MRRDKAEGEEEKNITSVTRREKFKFNKYRESLLIKFREMLWHFANRR